MRLLEQDRKRFHTFPISLFLHRMGKKAGCWDDRSENFKRTAWDGEPVSILPDADYPVGASLFLVGTHSAGAIRGNTGENTQKVVASDIFPIKLIASVLTVSALGFFFSLALRTCQDAAQRNDLAAQKSAAANVWASLFVLTAALIRLYDLNFMESVRRSLVTENVQPE